MAAVGAAVPGGEKEEGARSFGFSTMHGAVAEGAEGDKGAGGVAIGEVDPLIFRGALTLRPVRVVVIIFHRVQWQEPEVLRILKKWEQLKEKRVWVMEER